MEPEAEALPEKRKLDKDTHTVLTEERWAEAGKAGREGAEVWGRLRTQGNTQGCWTGGRMALATGPPLAGGWGQGLGTLCLPDAA